MLVLTRKFGQAVTIDRDIVVTVLGMDARGKVRIGIDAPKDRAIVRDDAIFKIRKDSDHAPAQ